MGEEIKKMADLLKSGGAMLKESCPQCASPLFRTPSGDIYCVNCNRKVVIVKTEEEAAKLTTPVTLASLEEAILLKLQYLEQKIRAEENVETLQALVSLTNSYLETLERVRKVRKVE
jgi:uncharacterized Zn finger protein (UPF0148 family)